MSDESMISTASLLKNRRVQSVLTSIKDRESVTIEQQVALSETAAPTFDEGLRSQLFQDLLVRTGVHDVLPDTYGNVIGRIGNVGNGPVLMITAHLDTVFDADTDVAVTKKGAKLYGPGICDDSRGLAAVLSVAKALVEIEDELSGGILIGANVCEEGKGNLNGIKQLMNAYNFDAFITVDGATPDRLITQATGCLSYVVEFEGPGGHSFGNFGRPSAIHAAARSATAIADISVPEEPKTIYNVGVLRGGVTETAIGFSCRMEIDLRSTDDRELAILDTKVRDIIIAAVERENDISDCEAGRVSFDMRQTVDIPTGSQAPDAPLVHAAAEGLRSVGLEPQMQEAATTDANVPISRGVQAVCMPGGGTGSGLHSTNESYDITNSHLGPQAVFIAALLAVGLTGISPLLEAESKVNCESTK
ncbi:M20/M25/M40 family metallo-hydrolase [Pseudoclavibacter sp. CFCC 13796]|uniref:M20/M25/M40 family metallo-hydrolase n=1 Tax=Pseudoclavibacter sp. CFCC 13796 TaxID=2615179 RepID=UPI001301156B|nr:M20/M25/M40 family metallo-hydrolase [Pseudoclavibacter sp. CFCC 13796]KAB1660868.1 M20/M25/M40 family metallo-hydrolase [Pseudoclavibacter sp. CFCC 13796]